MPEPSKAVFLSYAREDAEAAKRVAEALRGFGIEVWFDQSELRGGDQWDQKIRTQIKACALFVPVISATTQAREEAYFRLEWKLADDRSHLMAPGRAFIVPVVIDDTPDIGSAVPESFLRAQWTRLPDGLPTSKFIEQIHQLLQAPRKPALKPEAPRPPTLPPMVREAARRRAAEEAAPKTSTPKRSNPWGVLGVAAILIAAAIGAWFWRARSGAEAPPVSVPAATPKPATPDAAAAADKSIAVLPFANLSVEKENEYFADGVQDDIITNLAKIRGLKVISRTSTLAYRDAAARNLKKIASELNVAVVLEGSVRRVGSKVHMNAQLIDARTDAHLWADTFDGDTGDIFALQATLAQKIAAALKVTLTGNERTLIERRPTQNQEAYELYSRARILYENIGPFSVRAEYEPVIALLEQAVTKDPGFATAFAFLSGVHGQMFWFGTLDPTPERRQRSLAALESARRLTPDAPETHVAQGVYLYDCENNWRGALAEYALAAPNLPNDAYLQYRIGVAYRRLADWPRALACFEQSAALNPHDLSSVSTLVDSARALRRAEQTRDLAVRYLTLFPNDWRLQSLRLWGQFAIDGDRVAYARAWMAPKPNTDERAQLQFKYEGEKILGDFAAAERTLADPRLTMLTTVGGTTVEPVALHRALLAVARGQREVAAKAAAEAIAHFRNHPWTARQQPHIMMDMALAEACAGQAEAVRDGQVALQQLQAMDLYSAHEMELKLGKIYLILGRTDEAMAALRKAISVPGVTSPNDIRIDPLWAQLQADARFEEILKSTKPL